MSYVEKLKSWEQQAGNAGLVDVKFFAGDARSGIEDLAKAAYFLLAGDGEDVTEIDL